VAYRKQLLSGRASPKLNPQLLQRRAPSTFWGVLLELMNDDPLERREIMDGSFFLTKNGALELNVKVNPASSKTEISGVKNGRLCVKIAAAPEDGRANACLTAFLSKLLDCPKKEIRIKSGEKSRLKTVCLPLSCLESVSQFFCGL
jgi:uncharacterized protein (TIGR00251 family)